VSPSHDSNDDNDDDDAIMTVEELVSALPSTLLPSIGAVMGAFRLQCDSLEGVSRGA